MLTPELSRELFQQSVTEPIGPRPVDVEPIKRQYPPVEIHGGDNLNDAVALRAHDSDDIAISVDDSNFYVSAPSDGHRLGEPFARNGCQYNYSRGRRASRQET